ncbi:MAG: undecaprenyl/decaprenyl-phosphate alpha-N-acetylglucosaminyl 1-phosphate transferase [Fimbriimonadaceae bacterium]|jgi:UDP-GlcNAc:undecaprenyl-phosphate GlcNAc-1-phosphate transferase|nr:undecaprenyl/decaprenyl-phosphate alpha-N-acetylglucosaminyl 1-phosphate transferase [Fimbriimonadaceae bacterium]
MRWLEDVLSLIPGGLFRGFRAPLVAGLLAAFATWALTPSVIRYAVSKGAVDDPTRDDRRVHTTPTPRWGGIGVYAGFLIATISVLLLAYEHQPFPPYLIGVFIGGAILVGFGMWDDVRPASAKVQLAVLLSVGVLVQLPGMMNDKIGQVQFQGVTLPGGQWFEFAEPVAVLLTAIYIFIVTKTMDTIDGVDGLTSGIAAISATTLCIIGVLSGQPRVAILAAAVAGACIGFLRYNYNPARIFLGTGGAQVLGFLLASLSLVGVMKTAATLALVIPILVFVVPIFDALFVVTRRILSRQPVTQADKRHLHHTLLGQGLSQRQVVWVLYLVGVCCGGLLLFLVRRYG